MLKSCARRHVRLAILSHEEAARQDRKCDNDVRKQNSPTIPWIFHTAAQSFPDFYIDILNNLKNVKTNLYKLCTTKFLGTKSVIHL